MKVPRRPNTKQKNNMRNKLLTALLVVTAVIAVAATTKPITSLLDQVINSAQDTTALKIIKPGGVNSDFIQAYSGSNKKFAVNSNGVVSCLQFATAVTSSDGTVTNPFTPVFPAAPTVVSCQVGTGTTTTNIITVTSSNVVLNVGKGGVTNNLIIAGNR